MATGWNDRAIGLCVLSDVYWHSWDFCCLFLTSACITLAQIGVFCSFLGPSMLNGNYDYCSCRMYRCSQTLSRWGSGIYLVDIQKLYWAYGLKHPRKCMCMLTCTILFKHDIAQHGIIPYRDCTLPTYGFGWVLYPIVKLHAPLYDFIRYGGVHTCQTHLKI